MGLSKSVRNHVRVREDTQGWTDSQVIMSLNLLNLSGGDCVGDLNILEADEGFCRILRRVELHGLSRRERREQERRWRRGEKKLRQRHMLKLITKRIVAKSYTGPLLKAKLEGKKRPVVNKKDSMSLEFVRSEEFQILFEWVSSRRLINLVI